MRGPYCYDPSYCSYPTRGYNSHPYYIKGSFPKTLDCDSGKDLEQVLVDLYNPSLVSKYTVYDELDWGDSILVFFQGPEGKKYVLKQIKDNSPEEQFLLVLDAVGSLIAEDMNLPINRVRIVPPFVNPALKKISNQPATVHTLAQGIRVDRLPRPQQVNIQQRYRKEGTPMYEKYGPLPPDQEGLTPKVIQNLSKNLDLAQIVAFDTFLGNADRSKPNLFYWDLCNRFTGIDQASILRFNLVSAALRQINRLQKGDLSLQEQEGLRVYRDTLGQLQGNYPLSRIEAMLDQQAEIAGLLNNEDVAQRMRFHKRMERENLQELPELIEALVQLL